MPKDGAAGYSAYTPYKQAHFQALLDAHIAITEQIARKYPLMRYVYCDLTAGPGVYADGRLGSPLIAAQALARSALPVIEGFCLEEDLPTYGNLVASFPSAPSMPQSSTVPLSVCMTLRAQCTMRLFCLDSAHFLPTYFLRGTWMDDTQPSLLWGMIYIDSNGTIDDDLLRLLAQCNKRYRMIDIIIHCSATTVKRCFRSEAHDTYQFRLTEMMGIIGKKKWLIRQRYEEDAQQWTFLIGSNYEKFPDFKALGIHPITSEQGQEIIYDLNFTKKEKRAILSRPHQQLVLPSMSFLLQRQSKTKKKQ